MWSEQSTKSRHYVGSHFRGFFCVPYIEEVFGASLPAENKALSCVCLVPSVPGSPWERALSLTRGPAGTGVCQGDLVPEHLPVTGSWGLRTAQACASYACCLGGGLFLSNKYSLLTLCQEYSMSWNFLSLVVKNTLQLTFSMFDFFPQSFCV